MGFKVVAPKDGSNQVMLVPPGQEGEFGEQLWTVELSNKTLHSYTSELIQEGLQNVACTQSDHEVSGLFGSGS